MRTATALITLAAGIAVAGCRSEGDGSAVAELRTESRVAAAIADPVGSTERAPEVTLRRLWAGGYSDFAFSSISPDGRYLSMVDWSTANLAVRDLSTGEFHRLTSVRNEEGTPWEAAHVSGFSPDGRRIVYSGQVDPDFQLRIIEFESDDAGVPRAAEPTVIFHNPELVPYYPFDWSPDGSLVLAKVHTAGKTNQLALISTTDGTYQALKSFDWREPLRAEFSPDGRYVAYDFLPELESANRDLFVVSLDGTYEARIVEGPGVDRLLGWHPEVGILFRSDRGGTPGVWRVPMSDGRAAGPAELIRADMWGVEPLGFADDRFYYGVSVNPTRVYIAPVDLEAGKLAGPPVAVDDPGQIRIQGWDWSPDGKFLAYSGSTAGARGSVIVIRSDRGDPVRTVPLDLRATSRIRWDPDGRSLIVSSYDAGGRRGFYRIDLESGSYTTIVRSDQLEDPTPRGDFDISPDGRTIWFATAGDGGWTLVAYDLESGSSRAITPVEWRVRGAAMAWMFAMVSVSPDGRRLAVTVPDTTSSDRLVGTIPAEGGRFTAVARISNRGQIRGPEWSPDGRFLVYATTQTTGSMSDPDLWATWVVPADGGEARPLELMPFVRPHGPPMKLHPDGRRIAFRAGESRGEVWVMEGLGESIIASKEEGSR